MYFKFDTRKSSKKIQYFQVKNANLSAKQNYFSTKKNDLWENNVFLFD